MSLEDVELGGGFEVVHDERAFGGADGKTLSWAVKVDRREAVRRVSFSLCAGGEKRGRGWSWTRE